MPSPFPGMDPYLERPSLWVDFHNNFAAEIQAHLNQAIQPHYVARLTPYVTYEVIEIAELQSIRPDAGVLGSPLQGNGPLSGAAGLAPAPVISAVSNEVGVELFSVEIRTVDRKQLVTAIEILSPVNKRRGHRAQSDYLRKRADPVRSSAHLVEIDLLRGGERGALARPVPVAPYYVMLSRVGLRPQVEVWPIQLRDRLPNLPIPLHAPDPDVPLDLGACLATVYERAAYGADIDYREAPPPPALGADEAAWVDAWLRERGLR